MSRWRRKASDFLPEQQSLIASKLVDSPMMLWVELQWEFRKLCELEHPPIEHLSRFWNYCDWCLLNSDDDIRTAAALGFCEQLLSSDAMAKILPKIMKRSDFLDIRSLLEYHNTPEEVDRWLLELW
ncbi:hypothetical protein ACFSW8_03735 [Rubritalea tangerina]|uniref:HEAT repeat domain-containing protein n=1 Tax=Rubritalea tangerina TaxID=430798 RepID=A0ABW4Z8C6_9BACT